jgi:SAM-dependent methyltransferase
VLDAIRRFGGEAGLAVDLGCGAGRDTALLLRHGWRVLAVDAELEAIERLRARDDIALDRLETEVARMEDARWPPALLVNSSFALPFCPPERFDEVWQRIGSSLPVGGRFAGQLFGDRDDWAAEDGITTHTRPEAEALFRPFLLERFSEIEEDGHVASGEPKHWHVFHVVGRKL